MGGEGIEMGGERDGEMQKIKHGSPQNYLVPQLGDKREILLYVFHSVYG